MDDEEILATPPRQPLDQRLDSMMAEQSRGFVVVNMPTMNPTDTNTWQHQQVGQVGSKYKEICWKNNKQLSNLRQMPASTTSSVVPVPGPPQVRVGKLDTEQGKRSKRLTSHSSNSPPSGEIPRWLHSSSNCPSLSSLHRLTRACSKFQ